MRKSILRIGLIILLIIAIQLVLLKLFPYGGEVAGFTYGPGMLILILLSIFFGIIINLFRSNIIKNLGAIVLIFLCAIISLKYLYGEEEPINQFKKGIRYLNNPEEIEYKNLFGSNYQENSINVTAAIARYKNCLPEIGFRITYCCDPYEEYYLEKSDEGYFSSGAEIIINDSLGLNKSLIFKDSYLGKNFEFEISLTELKEKEIIRKTIKIDDQEIHVELDRCEFKPGKGFSKLYYALFNKILEKEDCE